MQENTLALKISVAMCTFNGSRFLTPQLESIAAQDRSPDELVVCDDGSSDRCIEIVREFSRRVEFPTRVVVNDRNLGSTKNFEQAISLCRGGIVVLADQDDVWYRHKLARIEKAFLRSNAIVAVFSDADLIDDHSRPLDLRLWNSFSFSPAEQRRFANGHALNVLVKHPVVTGATMAFRKEFFDLLAPIPANHVHDRWISFLLAASGQIQPISESLMQYRQYGEQQIGPGTVSFSKRLAQARGTGPGFYLKEIEGFREIDERLEDRKESFRHAELAQREIKRKISHRKHRAALPRTNIARIPKVFREVLNRGYWRYSEGWKSVAKDLFIER
jgi:glycosyltransferase involved in cell wall biosynthesis